jgi:hypothetical protein
MRGSRPVRLKTRSIPRSRGALLLDTGIGLRTRRLLSPARKCSARSRIEQANTSFRAAPANPGPLTRSSSWNFGLTQLRNALRKSPCAPIGQCAWRHLASRFPPGSRGGPRCSERDWLPGKRGSLSFSGFSTQSVAGSETAVRAEYKRTMCLGVFLLCWRAL